MIEKNIIIPKKPLIITVFVALLISFPILMFWVHSILTGVFVKGSASQIFLHPLYIIFAGAYIALLMGIYFSSSKKWLRRTIL